MMNLKVANLSLYAVAFVVFNVVGAGTPDAVENQVCNFSLVTLFILIISFGCILITFLNDQYRWIAYISIFIGSCFVIVFAIGTREPRSARLISLCLSECVGCIICSDRLLMKMLLFAVI